MLDADYRRMGGLDVGCWIKQIWRTLDRTELLNKIFEAGYSRMHGLEFGC